ncbi:acyl-CoA synthetase FdrA [Shouchella shacheensis]|uniref:acyl-CoA synthetase FdrA n=1 Tax=Shouchella shacheensis TaxID=1649580 RepID=UPI00073FAFA2|nr:acyl-CoA synthetase FdrA [Shouchella shacheensis]
MLHAVIKTNSYQDSVNLMLLTNQVSSLQGIERASVMMGTDANKDIFKNTGLFAEELNQAGANDMCIVVDTDNTDKVDEVLAEVEHFLKNQSVKSKGSQTSRVRSWEKATETLPNANLALISVPGKYAAGEAERALDLGLHAFIFSDNVPLEDEERLKGKAEELGLLVMGPDCGTGIISGVPLAFANVVREGNIGVIGASGTGIQEVTTLIDRRGGGIRHAVGTGGRDLSAEIGATTMLQSLAAFEEDAGTDVIVLVSKPPAESVRSQVLERLAASPKPVVVSFVGDDPAVHDEAGIYLAYTLNEAAHLALNLAKGNDPHHEEVGIPDISENREGVLSGLYSGGTLATEAAVLASSALSLSEGVVHEEGFMLKAKGHEIIDLGDDMYTEGRPHPMIDPTTRIEYFEKAAVDPKVAVVLFDVVLGYGAFGDPASAILPAIEQGKDKKAYVAVLCGTKADVQAYDEQKAKLEAAGVIVKESNEEAVSAALALLGAEVPKKEKVSLPVLKKTDRVAASEAIRALISEKPRVINVGLANFVEPIETHGGTCVQYDWRPVAGGNERMQKILQLLR